MDLLKSWAIAALIFLGLNFAISIVIVSGMGLLYFIAPLVGAIAACAYHAEHGVGGWLRHLVAVFPVPILLNVYGTFMMTGVPSDGEEVWMMALAGGAGAAVAGVGLGIVMLTRLLLTTRTPRDRSLTTE